MLISLLEGNERSRVDVFSTEQICLNKCRVILSYLDLSST